MKLYLKRNQRIRCKYVSIWEMTFVTLINNQTIISNTDPSVNTLFKAGISKQNIRNITYIDTIYSEIAAFISDVNVSKLKLIDARY